ncbi:MAG: aminoglycoside phosphotransferase family protein [Streptosporangiales bacterium]
MDDGRHFSDWRRCSLDDADIDEALVRALLHEQHPDLAGLGLRAVAGGWDNRMWRLGDELAVRLPRTPREPSLLRTEQRWLPFLAPGLPLPVPVPVRVGEPSARFPRTWTVVRWVDGEPADRAPISSPQAAGTLAGFLRALHRTAPGGAPASPDRGVPLAALGHDFDEWFPVVASSDVAAGVRRTWEQAVAADAWQDAPVWIHGDLHPANVVVSGGTLSGVIDFGDMCAGDPATDLAAAWVLLPAGTAARFFGAYASADDATIQRARGWAVLRALGLIGIGQNWERGLPGGKQTWGPAGWAALERILASG